MTGTGLHLVGADTSIVVVKDFRSHAGRCAIRKEAVFFREVLGERSAAEIPFVSIECDAASGPPRCEDGVWFVPLPGAAAWLPPSAGPLHVFESGVEFLFSSGLAGRKTVVHAAAADPLEGLSREQVEEVIHLSDHDMLWVAVHSERAEKTLSEAGVRNRLRAFPLIDAAPFERIRALPPRNLSGSCVVGFASMPFEPHQIAPRGLPLLFSLAKSLPQVVFKLAGRSATVDAVLAAEARAAGLENVVFAGAFHDMADFYATIDILVVPFLVESHNHAFPFSVVEAALCGRPVVVSRRCPIAEWVEQEGIGLVCDPVLSEFQEAIAAAQRGYDAFRANCAALARKIPSPRDTAARFLALHERMRGAAVPTLKSWREALSRKGRILHKTAEELAAYYSSAEVAGNYSAERFAAFPHSEEERIEALFVERAVEKAARGRKITIVDFAAGDGRLVRRLRRFGRCIAIDSSREMLEIIRRRYPEIIPYEHDILADELPLDPESVDCITCFRLARHLDFSLRRRLYDKVSSLLVEGGIFLLDFPSRDIETAVRNREGWGNYAIYDVFWTPEGIAEEMAAAGFEVYALHGVGKGRWHGVRAPSLAEAPGRWVAACRKRPGVATRFAPVRKPAPFGGILSEAEQIHARIRAFAKKKGGRPALDLYERFVLSPGIADGIKAQGHYDLAVLYLDRGAILDAFRSATRALSLDPFHDQAAALLSRIAAQPKIGAAADGARAAAALPFCAKEYCTYHGSAERFRAGEVWPGWWVLCWHLGVPVVQVGDLAVPPVGRAVDRRRETADPLTLAGVIAGAKLHFCEDPMSALLAASAGTPAVVLGGGAWLASVCGAGLFKLGVERGRPLSDIAVDAVLAAARDAGGCEAQAPKRSETAKCRRRLLRYCEGFGLDLGHGGDKIRKEAVGVDFFKQADNDVVSDVRNLSDFADETVDYVYSSHCLEDLEDTEGALREWLRPLRVKGHLVLYLPHKAWYPNVGTQGANPGHRHDFVPEDIEAVLCGIGGTEVVHRAVYPTEYSFELVARKVRSLPKGRREERGCGEDAVWR